MIPGDSPTQGPVPGPIVPYTDLFEIPLTPAEVKTRIIIALIEKGVTIPDWPLYVKKATELIFSEDDKHSGRE